MHQLIENFGFGVAEINFGIAPGQNQTFYIQHQSCHGQAALRTSSGIGAVGPAEMAFDFGEGNLIIERLRDVIIGSVFQRHHLIHFALTGRDEQDRAGGETADLAAPVVTVEFRQIHIQQHQMGGKLLELHPDSFKIMHCLRLIAEFM
ncbi:hypothetical protein D3C75_682520 [compost metagenome]